MQIFAVRTDLFVWIVGFCLRILSIFVKGFFRSAVPVMLILSLERPSAKARNPKVPSFPLVALYKRHVRK